MVLGSSPGRGIRARGAAWAAAAVLALGTAATACGDDNDGGAPPPKSPTETTAPAEPEPTGSAPADPAAAEKEIRDNWVKFFDPKVSLEDKEAVLENGAQMRQLLQGFSGDQRGQQVSAEVSKVKFTSATEADVTYSLALQGQTVMPSATGTAVEQDGTWKVSVKTLCALVQLSGNASPAPGC